MDNCQGFSSSTDITADKPAPSDQCGIDTDRSMDRAVRYHQSGQLEQAERIYKELLEINPNDLTAYYNLALACSEQGKTEEAIDCYRKVIGICPEDADAHYNLAVALTDQGKTDEALNCYCKAVEINPSDAEAYNNMGNILMEQQRLDEAAACFEKALSLNPNHINAYNNMGNALKELGKTEKAISCYQRVREIDPANAESLVNMGNALKERKKLDEALACFHKALSLSPNHARAYNNMGNALKEQGNTDEAVRCFQKAIQIRSDYPEAYINLGNAFKSQEKLDEAISCFHEALRLNPDYVEVNINIGNAYKEQGKLEQAVLCFQKVLDQKPDSAEAYIGIGSLFYEQGHMDDAVSCCEKALDLEQDCVEACYNLGITLAAQGKTVAAIEKYDQALKIDPGHADASWNRALAHLLLGHFKEGWEGYEQRKGMEWKGLYPYVHNLPRWDGSPFKGKRLFVHEEQGIGDTFHFIRYLPMAKARGGTVVFETTKRSAALFRDVEGIDILVERLPNGKPPIECDCYIPLLSLPFVFGTTLETIPAKIPYLYADAKKVNYWQDRLGGPGLKVGLVWRGNPNHKKDKSRSCALNHFSPLTAIPGIRLYGLQKGEAASEAEYFFDGKVVQNLGHELKDFSDTAALIESLDLIISVDTAVAHLAGAMGKAVWTLIAFEPDWRWLLDRNDTPWYPTMRLFRQSRRGDWGSAFRQVADAVREYNEKMVHGARYTV